MSTNCKFCGKAGLSWGPASRLVNPDGTLHVCDAYFKTRSGQKIAVAPGSARNAKLLNDPDQIKSIDDVERFTHWKPGDTMSFQGQEFEIWEIAVVEDPKDKTCCRVLYFDEDEQCRGWQKMRMENPNA